MYVPSRTRMEFYDEADRGLLQHHAEVGGKERDLDPIPGDNESKISGVSHWDKNYPRSASKHK
jgi:hypothetical protein